MKYEAKHLASMVKIYRGAAPKPAAPSPETVTLIPAVTTTEKITESVSVTVH
jgi:hypothetical protein